LRWIEVRDFRNLAALEFAPAQDGLTVVTGENGAGKTSILEAISYCSTEQSFRGSPREALVRTGAERAVVRSETVEHDRRALVEIEIAPPRRDQVFINRQRLGRAGQLLEVLQVTIFTPDDLILIKGGPQERRDYLDDVLVMAHPLLVPVRQALDRALRQRASLLKQVSGRLDEVSTHTLDVWDEQLAVAGSTIVEAREALVDELQPAAASAFARLTQLPGELRLTYQRSFGGSLSEALGNARVEDLRRGVTTVGPHRDDLHIALGDLDARTRLSQGRQRAATLALRLAAHEVVTEHVGARPVLLLDDAFSELDSPTALALFSELPPGQAILTTAGSLPTGAEDATRVELRNGQLFS
jgi:DNA replication and repair protein RecF